MEQRRPGFCINGESVKLLLRISESAPPLHFRKFLFSDVSGVILSSQMWQLFFCRERDSKL